MIKLDPLISVTDVERSVEWYCQVFDCERAHGGKGRFAVLELENNEVLLCLHNRAEGDHPTLTNPGLAPGNGLLLYFRAENMDTIRQNVEKAGLVVDKEVYVNPNSEKREFSIRDPDGYYLTISEFHSY
jgi:predicted enzyme related to lactoylglutathione lyase